MYINSRRVRRKASSLAGNPSKQPPPWPQQTYPTSIKDMLERGSTSTATRANIQAARERIKGVARSAIGDGGKSLSIRALPTAS